jgi:hypothetical protein
VDVGQRAVWRGTQRVSGDTAKKLRQERATHQEKGTELLRRGGRLLVSCPASSRNKFSGRFERARLQPPQKAQQNCGFSR